MKKDLREALYWCEKAAEQGDENASYVFIALGNMKKYGESSQKQSENK